MAQTEKYNLYVVGAGEDPYVKDVFDQLCGENASNMTIIDSELKNLAAEVSLLKTSVSEGKALIASAVTDMGVQTADDAEFALIASNIAQIETGIDTSDATAVAGELLLGRTAYVNGEKITGTIPTRSSSGITVEADRVYIRSGYYADNISRSVGTVNQAVPTFDVVDQYNGTALIIATANQEAGYVNAGTRTNTMYINPSVNYGTSNNGVLTIMPYDAANRIDGKEVQVSIPALDSDLAAENIKSGVNIFGVSGNYTSDATATAIDIYRGRTAYVDGQLIEGAMEDCEISPTVEIEYEPNAEIATLINSYTVSGGYVPADHNPVVFETPLTGIPHQVVIPTQERQKIANAKCLTTGSLYVEGDANLSSENIKSGVTIFGVSGATSVVGTSDANASSADMANGKTAYINGSKVTGTIAERGEADITTSDNSVTIPAGLYRSDVTKTVSSNTGSEWTYVYFSSDSSHPSDDIVSSVTHNFNDGSGMTRTFDITLTKDFLDAKLVYAAGVSNDASCQTFFVCPSIEEHTGVDYEGMYYDDDDGGLFPIIDVAYNNFYITKKIEVDIAVGSSNSVLLVDALYGYLAVKF